MGRSNNDFHKESGNSEYSLRFTPGVVSPDKTTATMHEVTAHTADGTPVGSLKWNSVWEGKIHDVYVDPKHRRRGLATKMLNMAKSTGHPIEHAQFRTKEGEKWAKSTGDSLPPLQKWKRK